jgi:hypothetical protein
MERGDYTASYIHPDTGLLNAIKKCNLDPKKRSGGQLSFDLT